MDGQISATPLTLRLLWQPYCRTCACPRDQDGPMRPGPPTSRLTIPLGNRAGIPSAMRTQLASLVSIFRAARTRFSGLALGRRAIRDRPIVAYFLMMRRRNRFDPGRLPCFSDTFSAAAINFILLCPTVKPGRHPSLGILLWPLPLTSQSVRSVVWTPLDAEKT